MAKNYRSSDYAWTIAELIEKHQFNEKRDGKTTTLPFFVTESSIQATTQFFVQSSNNWFPSVISLDKTFRKN